MPESSAVMFFAWVFRVIFLYIYTPLINSLITDKMEKIRKTLADSKAARWTALAVVAFTMLCGYYLTDVMAPSERPMLEQQLSGTVKSMDSSRAPMAGSMSFF